MKPVITVVIPTHNRPDGLAAAVDSIFNQTLLPGELIVVDDGSNPPVTQDVFLACPNGLTAKLTRNESPKGAPNARNRGILEANGDWIAFLDDDDEFFPEKIEWVSDTINKSDKSIDLIYHPAKINMLNERISYYSKPRKFSEGEDVFRLLLLKNHIGGTSMVVARKSALLTSGLFDEQLPALQDYEMWLRMAKNNFSFFFIDKPLTNYLFVTNQKSITSSTEAGLNALTIIENKYQAELKCLTEKERKQFDMRRHHRMIRAAYLNKKNVTAARLHWKAFLTFKSPKYLFGAISSLFGSRFVFWLRAWKS